MLVADTEITPLLDDGAEDGSGAGGSGDAEEGTFLGSKHKVAAAVVTSAAEADAHTPRAGPHVAPGAGHHHHHHHHQDAASSSYGFANMTLRRLFFATPLEKKDDDAEGDVSMRTTAK